VTILCFYGERLLTPSPTTTTPPPSRRTTPCRLSTAAYSIYSQLPSITGGCPSIHNPGTHHAVVTRDPPNMGLPYIRYIWLLPCVFIPKFIKLSSLFPEIFEVPVVCYRFSSLYNAS
jgi:hypothetical protein